MERAIHITNLKNLKYFREGDYQRIYWGIECCQNLIPFPADIEKLLRFVKKNNIAFTFVTPFVTESGLRKLNAIFSWLKKNRVNCEIVVNDWGVLESLNREFKGCFGIALGRLLVRQQRDMTLKKILEKQPPLMVREKDGKLNIIMHKVPGKRYQDGARQSYVNSFFTQEFLAEFGVQRVELNNILQGLNLKGIWLKKSLYTPFVNISTTRSCPMETSFQKIYRINVCRRECQKHYEILRNKRLPKIIYKRGNTTFYKNPIDARIISSLTRMGANVDRIVFQPELPL